MDKTNFTPPPTAPLLISAWSTTTTLADWQALPADVRKSTARAAASLPYKEHRRRKDKQPNSPYNRRRKAS